MMNRLINHQQQVFYYFVDASISLMLNLHMIIYYIRISLFMCVSCTVRLKLHH